VQVIPILRAGLVLLEQSATLLPASETYHLGYVRDDETLKVSSSSSRCSSFGQV
jgi:uracil phosphoribosyltransferase